MIMVTPTKKQKIMLDFIDAFVKGNGYSPTLREIMQALDYKSVSTVAKHVDNLIVRGWLIKRDGEARSLEVATETDHDNNSQDHVAWLLGLVEKKRPEFTDSEIDTIMKAMELLKLKRED